MSLLLNFNRFREVITTNDVQPWELATVFKHILINFLNQRQYIEEEGLSMEVWSSQYKKQGSVTPIMPQGGSHEREEIPTVSGYVDRAMRHPSLFTPSRIWDLPYYYPGPLRPKGESTTLWEDTTQCGEMWKCSVICQGSFLWKIFLPQQLVYVLLKTPRLSLYCTRGL